MKNLINDLKEIHKLIKRYYNDKKYKYALKTCIDCLHYIYCSIDDFDMYQNDLFILGITDIWVNFNKSNDMFIFTIKLKRPGLLIGTGGSMHMELIKELEHRLNRPVLIDIIEEKRF